MNKNINFECFVQKWLKYDFTKKKYIAILIVVNALSYALGFYDFFNYF